MSVNFVSDITGLGTSISEFSTLNISVQGCSYASTEEHVSRKALREFFSLYSTMSGNLNSYLSAKMCCTLHYSSQMYRVLLCCGMVVSSTGTVTKS